MSYIKNIDIKDIVLVALREDIGARDVTSEVFTPKNKIVKAAIFAKSDCVACGLSIASLVFRLCDQKIKFKSLVRDGDYLKKGGVLAQVYGKARSILAAERVALNFLALLSGISTKTREFVDEIKNLLK